MVHVKEHVLYSNNKQFEHEYFPNVDLTKVEILFEDLQSGKDDSFCKEFRMDGFNFFVLCNFLAQELLKDVIGEEKIGSCKQINWLTEHLYSFNDREWIEKGGKIRLPPEAIEE